MPINQNQAPFSLLGTRYGGDGKSTFALPNMQGNAPMHPGQGPGLSLYDLGQTGGSETVTLLQSEIPVHSHDFMASQADGISRLPEANLAANMIGVNGYAAPGAVVQMAPQSLAPAGGSLPHNNMQPYLTLSFCIALQGVFPPRT